MIVTHRPYMTGEQWPRWRKPTAAFESKFSGKLNMPQPLCELMQCLDGAVPSVNSPLWVCTCVWLFYVVCAKDRRHNARYSGPARIIHAHIRTNRFVKKKKLFGLSDIGCLTNALVIPDQSYWLHDNQCCSGKTPREHTPWNVEYVSHTKPCQIC